LFAGAFCLTCLPFCKSSVIRKCRMRTPCPARFLFGMEGFCVPGTNWLSYIEEMGTQQCHAADLAKIETAMESTLSHRN